MTGRGHAVVVGAGVGGLACAVDLAAQGVDVTVVEAHQSPGGKLREVRVGTAAIDAGPTVFTMRQVFEALFADAGSSLEAHLHLEPATVLARHAWNERDTLDLFADPAQTADAIAGFSGPAEGRRYLDFCRRSARVFATLEDTFIRASRPGPLDLVRRAGLRGLPELWAIDPFSSLWRSLSRQFSDPRLQQLFARYATYCGSSPFAAPATLMLVAHVEQSGVWLVRGGMQRIAHAMVALATGLGVRFRFGARVTAITRRGEAVNGVEIATGERIEADVVIVNGDPAAVAAGLLGPVRDAVPRASLGERSLSAVTWLAVARVHGFPLARHSVFFSRDYPTEFRELFTERRVPADPTVYVCAQDRSDSGARDGDGPERLLCLVNAPATGDTERFGPAATAVLEACARSTLRRCGLEIAFDADCTRCVTPADFEGLFPGTGGALYGPASHGFAASFRRPGARTRVAGLYLAGGATHPGPGVPMAVLSGRLAARSALQDLGRQQTPAGDR